MQINKESKVRDIVLGDYRTTEVFKKYAIPYCCGGNLPISTVSMKNGIEESTLVSELASASQQFHLPPQINFQTWPIDFLLDYIVIIQHGYLSNFLEGLKEDIVHFAKGHSKQFPYLGELGTAIDMLQKEIIPRFFKEQEILFPYIRQVAHANEDSKSLAAQLVKTMRKPVELLLHPTPPPFSNTLAKIQALTNNFLLPEKACTRHAVIFAKLKALNDDLEFHSWLENEVLLPRFLEIEKESFDGAGKG